jgi:uncharacterized protein YdhG (YjbR/CyaY superfamily)
MSTAMTVDAYIKAQPKEVQPILKKVRETIRAAAPKAEEAISYGMPGYKMNGKALVYFGAFKKHLGFFATPAGNAAFKKEISAYKTSKGTVQFQYDEPIPYPLIKKMVAYRVKENKLKTKKPA